MNLESTLKVFSEAEVPAGSGIVPGQIRKRLAGTAEHPSERIMAILATYKPGSIENLHWHITEAFHFIISGHAVVRDIENNTYDVGPGSVIYTPPGIAGSHEWEVKEGGLQLLAIRATTEPEKSLQLWVDKATKESKVALDQLGGAVDFKKSLY